MKRMRWAILASTITFRWRWRRDGAYSIYFISGDDMKSRRVLAMRSVSALFATMRPVTHFATMSSAAWHKKSLERRAALIAAAA